MLCDVVLALLVTFDDGHTQKLQRQGAAQAQVQLAKDQVATMQKDPKFQAALKKQGIKSVELEVKQMPKPFDCSQDPEAESESK